MPTQYYYKSNKSTGGTNYVGPKQDWDRMTNQERDAYRTVDFPNEYNGELIDDVPTEGSQNLVRSGGVYSSNPQVSTIPTPSVDILGKIVQFVGTTTQDYKNGYFYKCVSDGESTPTYSWEETSVQQGGGSGSGGHTIVDADGTEYTQRSNLVIENGWVEDDSTNDATILRSNNFVGTRAQWNALSVAEKVKYTSQDITDEYGEYPVDPVPTQGSAAPVSSNGVYAAIQTLTNQISSKADTASVISDVYEVTTPAFSSLPQTFTAQGITANHNLVVDGYAKLSNPSAQGSDWTVTTGANTITISGTFSGSTATTVTMTLGVKRSITATA